MFCGKCGKEVKEDATVMARVCSNNIYIVLAEEKI